MVKFLNLDEGSVEPLNNLTTDHFYKLPLKLLVSKMCINELIK